MALPTGGRGKEAGDLDDDLFVAEEQLTLSGGDERLPWLESGDDFDEPGVDTGRIVAFAAAGLLVIVLLVGALWWFLRDDSAAEVLADGSTIEAPEQPYKTRPDDGGGRQVAGTGDRSFEVAEGREVEARIAGGDVPAPSIDREQATAGEDKIVPVATPGVGVQVGAYSSREAAEAGWSALIARLAPLEGRSHRVVEGTADSGRIFRLQAVAGSTAEADALCRSLRAAGGDCQVKR
jgi:hypothetical protein